MASPTPRPQHGSQPSLAALTARLLDRVALDPGLAPDGCSDGVEPHEALSGFRTDARTTWADALLALRVGAEAANLPPAPANWGSLCRQLPPRHAVALCVGNYPQLLGDMSGLFAEPDLRRLAAPSDDVRNRPDAATLRPGDRARNVSPQVATLLTVAAHRLAGEFGLADDVLRATEGSFTGQWRDVWVNERAAILWEAGRHADAVAAWEKLPDGALKAFNLGMAELFTGNAGSAKAHLTAACECFPESSGWNHIARLYLALCDR